MASAFTSDVAQRDVAEIVVDLTPGDLAGHDPMHELLLALYRLVHEHVEGLLGDVAVRAAVADRIVE